GVPLNEEPQHKLQWQAHLEFALNSTVEDFSWANMKSSLPRSEKLQQLVSMGVPHSMRPQVWMRLCGAIEKKHQSEITYDEIVEASLCANTSSSAEIEKDLLRTMPNNACFSSADSPGVDKLQRGISKLRSWRWFYPDGLITAHLLLFMKEEDAFWMMCSTFDHLLPSSYYRHNLCGVHADQRVLRQLVAQYLPNVEKSLNDHDIGIIGNNIFKLSLITLHWFITLFAGVLHIKVLLRVWDAFFLDGSIVMFKVAMGMLKMKEEMFGEVENSAEIFNTLSDIPSLMDDADMLLQAAQRTAGSLSQMVLDTHRKKHEAYLLGEGGAEVSTLSHVVILYSLHHTYSSTVDEEFENMKAKNIKQTELVSSLKQAIQMIIKHFQTMEHQQDTDVSVDYSSESHTHDHEHYMSVGHQRRQRARALLDFQRSDDDELGFRKNDIITIISMKDEHCWVGELNGLQGWFPAKFVELLDERSKTYTSAGDGSVNKSIVDLVRGVLCPALAAIFEHGLRRPVLLGSACHPWQFVEEAAAHEIEKDFDSVFSRLVLCKTFRLDDDGKVLTPEELLYRCIQAVNMSHNSAHAQMDVKLRSLVCYGLNEQVLHMWLESLCSSVGVVRKWYHPWSYLLSPGWVQIKCELRLLSKFTFYLPPDWELPKTK
uniref:RUN and TBC1 domain-containing protein 3 n=1 Tax=Ciona savignyi TaxID=51511 RepID=H2ZEX4_CIOSA